MQIYIGNLPLEFTDIDLKSMFEPFGTVAAAAIGKDKKTGASEGYGIVEMPVKHEARTAVDALRGKDMQGKPLRVRALKPGDDFHTAGRPVGSDFHASRKFRGDVSNRGAGAIRRGGQRGS
ncbi:MAG: RNA-binding protein [Ignavibacteriae bacterium]|nr:RNA-binding protein [Ignavibacteria bacterium]MBI3363398.1 RNA-binding protein [Ignavibacteriota bacterium]